MEKKIDFVGINTKRLPNGHTVRRGEVMEYTGPSGRTYHAVVLGWSSSGKTLTMHKASVRWDETRIPRIYLHNGKSREFDVRYKPETGNYGSNKAYGYTLEFPEGRER